jgi:hypothetical protein
MARAGRDASNRRAVLRDAVRAHGRPRLVGAGSGSGAGPSRGDDAPRRSLGLLVSRLPAKKESPKELLVAAGALWISNLLVFACWYWRLDAGGPHERALQGSHTDGAFLFPQMMLEPELRREMGEDKWKPGFIDYLFLAFNTSTAFSPTDVPVLSRWAKALMMIQSAISLATIALLAARAVNIL